MGQGTLRSVGFHQLESGWPGGKVRLTSRRSMGSCFSGLTPAGNDPAGITKSYEDLTQRYLSRFRFETQITILQVTA